MFNLGESRTVELNELISLLEKELDMHAIIDRQPPQPGDVPQTFADISKARALLGYDPKTQIEEGLHRFVEWFQHDEFDKTGKMPASACPRRPLNGNCPKLRFMKILDEQEQLKQYEPVTPAIDSPEVSVFLPVYNEEPNLFPLHAKLDDALKSSRAIGRDRLRRRWFYGRKFENPARDRSARSACARGCTCGETTVKPRRWQPVSMPQAGKC